MSLSVILWLLTGGCTLSRPRPPRRRPAISRWRRTMTKTVYIYTDGACSGNPGPGGWGAILLYQGQERYSSAVKPPPPTTRMELTAVIQALGQLKVPCQVELYSDSRYVIDALSKGWVFQWQRPGVDQGRSETGAERGPVAAAAAPDCHPHRDLSLGQGAIATTPTTTGATSWPLPRPSASG